MEINAQALLQEVINREASDLHIIQGYPPTVRVNGQLIQLTLYPALTPKDIQTFFLSFSSKEQQESFSLNKELDFGLVFQDYRFRVNAYYERDSIAISLRLIPKNIRTIDQLELPAILHEISDFQQGFVLLTGQTGQGKSTTLAGILNEINYKRKVHIITIEDPIEFMYPKGKSIISQREIKKDTLSFNKALRSVLREDPDIIVIGEMRDYETISIALTLAETGHLVFSTLHTNTAPQTIDRIIDVFPEEQQPQIRTQLANVLKSIVCQRLVPTTLGDQRTVACEILFNNTAISSLIREGKTYQIDNVIQTSGEEKMIIFERYLKALITNAKISPEIALKYAFRPKLMKGLIS
ncbi:MAG: PilT/PilU family type 4a pilus ATPase [Patescibacteria group bacterium]|jgi:twitching motility protein PilT